MSNIMGWIIVLMIVGWLAYNGYRRRVQQDAEDSTFFGAHRGWDVYKSAYDRGVIAIEHDKRRIALGTVTNYVECPWSDISGVEVEKNGQSLTQTNRGSQVMGAAVGGLLLGPLGLLMGGVSGSKRQRERINEMSLKILIDDRAAPVHRITFFRMPGNGADAQDRTLKGPASKMEHFHALIANAIRSDNRSVDRSGVPAIGAMPTHDRIAKLWDLKQAGALTADEFESEKRNLLASKQVTPITDEG